MGGKINGLKKTRLYKDIRLSLADLFDFADFRDYIINGISFKWYLRSEITNRWGNPRYIKENIEKYLSENFRHFPINIEVKVLESKKVRMHYDSLRIFKEVLLNE
jgi:hypothetical protein